MDSFGIWCSVTIHLSKIGAWFSLIFLLIRISYGPIYFLSLNNYFACFTWIHSSEFDFKVKRQLGNIFLQQERWLSSLKALVDLSERQVKFPALTCWLTTSCYSCSSVSQHYLIISTGMQLADRHAKKTSIWNKWKQTFKNILSEKSKTVIKF